MGLLQPGHLILLLVIALVIVGPGKIAGIGGALGSSIRDFRKAVDDDSAAASVAAAEVKPASITPLSSPVSAVRSAPSQTEVAGSPAANDHGETV